MGAPLPHDEFERLKTLSRYSILDTLPEEAFDRITELTAMCLDVPVAVINFVDEDRQWGKSCYGLLDSEAPREDSFCAWTILHEDVMVVHDARNDRRFHDNPMVVGAPNIHLYAGAPLITPEGHRIGTLCVTDDKPRAFGERERQILRRLSLFVMNELELRRQKLEAEREAAAHARLAQEYRQTRAHAQTLLAIGEIVALGLSRDDLLVRVAELLAQTIPVSWIGVVDGSAPHGIRACWAAPGLGQSVGAHYREDVLLDGAIGPQGGEETFVEALDPDQPAERLLRVAWLPLLEEDGLPVLTLCVTRAGGSNWTYAERQLLRSTVRCLQSGLERDLEIEAMRREARLDTLTGLWNRKAFNEDLAQASQRGGRPFSLVIIDLDGLKAVNDTRGHAGGDALLKCFAQSLREAFREEDLLFRLGGDEFAVLVPGADRWGIITLLVTWINERVDSAVEATRLASFPTVSASVGMVVWPHDGTTPEDLYRLADERMYVRKRERRQMQVVAN